jgi:hypothetical protein
MGLPAPSTLSMLGRLMQRQLRANVFDTDSNVDITVDTPAAIAKSLQESTSKGLLNLFFYRIEPSGFYADRGARDRWYIRVRCLVTAFNHATTEDANTVPAGEIDLRVLGEVLRYFNENPIIVPQTAEEDVGAHLQITFSPLSSEEINQIWSTQGDVPYRPSLLYDISLLPVEPKVHASPPLPVVAGGLHSQVRANIEAARHVAPPAPGTIWDSPRLAIGEGPDWTPALSFVAGGHATQSLSLGAIVGLTVPVWVAGRAAAPVHLIWQHIDRGVWVPVETGGTVDVVVPSHPNPPGEGVIEPTSAGTAALIDVAVPVPAKLPAYLLLHAERAAASGAVLASNPLILTVRP